jgi:hypothetical protein
MRQAIPRLAVVAALGLLAAGCSRGRVKMVTGSVLLDGKPVDGAQVQLVPQKDLGLGSLGATTGADGKFTIAVGGPGRVIKPGRYVALVTKGAGIGLPTAAKGDPDEKELMKATAPGISAGILPARYADPETSPFTVDIKEGTTELAPLELKSKP